MNLYSEAYLNQRDPSEVVMDEELSEVDQRAVAHFRRFAFDHYYCLLRPRIEDGTGPESLMDALYDTDDEPFTLSADAIAHLESMRRKYDERIRKEQMLLGDDSGAGWNASEESAVRDSAKHDEGQVEVSGEFRSQRYSPEQAFVEALFKTMRPLTWGEVNTATQWYFETFSERDRIIHGKV